MNTHLIGSLIIGCLVLPLTGCGPKVDPNRPKTEPVTGVVSYNGQPVEDATVMFVSTGAAGRGSVGRTDSSGKFSVTTFEPGDGAVAGSYAVTISKRVVEDVEDSPVTGRDVEPVTSIATELLPVTYKDVASSGLTAEVTEGGENHFQFDLTD